MADEDAAEWFRKGYESGRASPEGRDTGGGMTPREDEGDDGPEPWNDAANALEWEADRASEEADEMAEMQMVGRDYKALRDKAFDYRALAKCLRLASPLPAGGAEPDELVEFFRNEMPEEGHYGDWRGDSPEQCAIHVMRKQRDEIARLNAARPDRKDANA